MAVAAPECFCLFAVGIWSSAKPRSRSTATFSAGRVTMPARRTSAPARAPQKSCASESKGRATVPATRSEALAHGLASKMRADVVARSVPADKQKPGALKSLTQRSAASHSHSAWTQSSSRREPDGQKPRLLISASRCLNLAHSEDEVKGRLKGARRARYAPRGPGVVRPKHRRGCRAVGRSCSRHPSRQPELQ